MTAKEILRLLGLEKKNADVLRLVDGVVPSVDFVDLGANGEGETGWLVRKGRNMKLGEIKRDANGNFTFFDLATKNKGEGEDPLKLSPSNLEAITKMIAGQKTTLEALEKALAGAEEDESAEDLPDAITTLLAGLSKAGEPDGGKEAGKTDEGDPDPAKPATEPAAAPAAKASKADEDTFTVGDLTLTGEMARTAKGMADAAGARMDDPEFAQAFAEKIGGFVELQAELDPAVAVNQAVGAVSKRMDTQVAELREENKNLTAMVTALAASGGLPGLLIPDGSGGQPKPTKKKRSTPAIPCGQDVNLFTGDGPAVFVEG